MTELTFGPLGYGGAGLGNHLQAISDDEAHELLQTAWDCGIRHFDTAPHYGLGLSERRLGRFLSAQPRDEFVVSTKVGRRLVRNPSGVGGLDGESFVVPADHRRVWDFTPTGIRACLEESLSRLGLDAVDVVYLHDPERYDLRRGLVEALPALAELRDQGLATAVGLASMDAGALLAGVQSGVAELIMAAGRFTLVDQAVVPAVTTACRDRGVGIVAAAVFNGGLLATTPGKHSSFDYGDVPDNVLARARAVDAICSVYEVPLSVAALQFPLREQSVRSVVVGGRTPGEIRANRAALDFPVPEALWDDLRSEGLVAS